MTFAPAEPQRWPAVRWIIAIAFVCALQGALVFLLENRQPVVPRQPQAAPRVRLSEGQGEWLALADPTLFALPHRQSFSGLAWLTLSNPPFVPAKLAEQIQYLPLPANHLGAGYISLLARAANPTFQTIRQPNPELQIPEINTALPIPPRSTLRIEGDLARRRLLSPPRLSVQTNPDVLTNSLVRLLVDMRGNTFSAVLLPPGSGSSEADQRALDQRALEIARAARFEPASAPASSAHDPSAGLTVGLMIFEWQTLLTPSTNAPGATR